ncbi:MAG: chemotaxis protein CheW [Clostridia bacterium]|nr:chemotaxis protein CheW [Clostridia bacterium]MDD4047920.1 chemotaxis protein CheW [Clostridia bacterium]
MQYVIFKLGKEEYGTSILSVNEIIKPQKTNKLPNTPEYVLGIINLRGNVIPIIDLKKRFNMESMEETKETRIVVIKQGKNAVGIFVDQVQEVLYVDDEDIKSCDEIYSKIDKEFIKGIARLENRLVILLNLSTVI